MKARPQIKKIRHLLNNRVFFGRGVFRVSRYVPNVCFSFGSQLTLVPATANTHTHTQRYMHTDVHMKMHAHVYTCKHMHTQTDVYMQRHPLKVMP